MNENQNINNENAENGGENQNPEKKSGSLLRDLFDWLETFAFAFAFVLIVFTFIFRIVTVDGSSMHYTLDDGDKLIISDVLYTPKYGDIIVVSNERTGKPIIKRVIATEGQTVDINPETWEITVDGTVIEENYINDEDKVMGFPLSLGGAYEYPITVSENCVFALGDNRNRSADSRTYGEFHEDDIVGRVLFRLFPFSEFGTVKPATPERVAEIKAKAD